MASICVILPTLTLRDIHSLSPARTSLRHSLWSPTPPPLLFALLRLGLPAFSRTACRWRRSSVTEPLLLRASSGRSALTRTAEHLFSGGKEGDGTGCNFAFYRYIVKILRDMLYFLLPYIHLTATVTRDFKVVAVLKSKSCDILFVLFCEKNKK